MKTFTHQQVQEILHAGQEAAEMDREALAQHLAACAECRAYAALVNELALVVPGMYATAALSEREIRQKALDNHQRFRRQSIMTRITQGTRSVVTIGAVLALLLVLVILSPRLLPDRPGTVAGPTAAPRASTDLAPTPEPTEGNPTSAGSFQYTVEEDDTLIGIADKFNLKPQTVLWANIDVLFDDPHKLQPGIMLRIPSVDGLYYRWEGGDTIETVAAKFGAEPQAIRDWPENAGLFEPRVEIFIPGGERPMQPVPTIITEPDEVQTEEIPFCAQLNENYTPADGFKLYCDEQYQYAFDYPLGWEIEGLDRPTPDPKAFPEAYPQVLQFFERNYRNQVYIYTGVLPEGSSLLDVVRNHNAYGDRAFKKDYSPMQIGGKPAYGFVNRHVQDYSGVSLFFEHGDFYTLMYMKIISPAGLGVNWQIAGSIQVPGASPENNVISNELIDDSYFLIGAVRPTPTVQPTAPVSASTGEFELYFYRPLVVDYDPAIWEDRSEPHNLEMRLNPLQHREMESCTVGTAGPSGFYPESMPNVTLGEITYAVFEGQNPDTGQNRKTYFFVSATQDVFDEVLEMGGIPILYFESSPAEMQDCQSAAEVVFATLNPSERLINMPYCEKLARDYRTPPNYITYCDPDYNFAFDYPEDWWFEALAEIPDSAAPQFVRRVQRFQKPDMSNYIRVDTYRLPETSTLEDVFKAFFAYDDREFPDHEYAELRIGGKRAYAIVRRSEQDISAVYLFFQHGEYYTVFELKAITSPKLDTNWKIARSIQVPGATLNDNFFPNELLIDSYHLVR